MLTPIGTKTPRPIGRGVDIGALLTICLGDSQENTRRLFKAAGTADAPSEYTMTQSDSIPPVPIGQDGSGPDKSTATILPYTQKGTPSTLANDGLLGGPLVESDAELIALGWIEPPPTHHSLTCC